ncbi:MAG: phosphohydrolase [Blautia sp.]|uniref:phosphohydrolase n=1 Tax=Blautia sp. TaxID=1955243 RepID=UPI0039916E14
MNIMNTFTGLQFDPLKMTVRDVSLKDIAHALSFLCRGGGQTLFFYSVAQHSLNCAREAHARGWSERMILACLLHDASEAYISDIIRPVKVHLANYLEIEEMIMNVIWKKFNLDDLSSEENAMWKQIDNDILSAELPVLFPGEKNHRSAALQSSPDLIEHPFHDIEERFLKAAHLLGIS